MLFSRMKQMSDAGAESDCKLSEYKAQRFRHNCEGMAQCRRHHALSLVYRQPPFIGHEVPTALARHLDVSASEYTVRAARSKPGGVFNFPIPGIANQLKRE